MKRIIALILMMILLAGCSDADSNGNNSDTVSEPIIITSENYEQEVLKSGKTVLLDFYADWCNPCKILAPTIKEIANERPDIVVGKINIDDEPELANQFNIESIPTLAVIKNGSVSKIAVGVCPKSEILSWL